MPVMLGRVRGDRRRGDAGVRALVDPGGGGTTMMLRDVKMSCSWAMATMSSYRVGIHEPPHRSVWAIGHSDSRMSSSPGTGRERSRDRRCRSRWSNRWVELFVFIVAQPSSWSVIARSGQLASARRADASRSTGNRDRAARRRCRSRRCRTLRARRLHTSGGHGTSRRRLKLSSHNLVNFWSSPAPMRHTTAPSARVAANSSPIATAWPPVVDDITAIGSTPSDIQSSSGSRTSCRRSH